MYKNTLFRKYKLSAYLENSLNNFRQEIDSLSLVYLNENKPEEIASTIISKYTLQVPKLILEKMSIDAIESQVWVDDRMSGFINRGQGGVTVKGLAITVTIPFEGGSSQLFECMASTYSLSGTPEAQIQEGKVVLTYETVEKDPEKIKLLWNRDIELINQNLAWINADLQKHNSVLSSLVTVAIAKRKGDVESVTDLISKLRQ